MEILIMIDALKRASAGRINAIIPYYGYARQDRKAKPRQPITSKLVADLLTVAGVNRVVTIDLHARQIQGFFDIPVDEMQALPLICKYFKDQNLEDLCVVSPDHGGATRARQMSEYFDCPIAIIDKRRPKPNVAEVMGIIGDVSGKNCILIDDMIDTGGTITAGVDMLKQKGAKDVYIACTHGVLSGPAINRLANCDAKEVVVTDTIPLPPE
jgi:ribose-phosphate pyrophosphokinase